MKPRTSFRNYLFRMMCLLVLLVITIFEVGPVPISGLALILVVLFRPEWFYRFIQKIYDVNDKT